MIFELKLLLKTVNYTYFPLKEFSLAVNLESVLPEKVNGTLFLGSILGS
jgi:hypothetical protein